MNKKKLIIGAMIIVFLVSLLKMTLIPGRGILTTLITISAAFIFLNVLRQKHTHNLISDEEEEETKSPAYAKILEVILGISLSILTIGILFKLMHWPNANFMLSASFFSILICTCLILLTYNTSNCSYLSSARAIAIASFLYALLFGPQFYYHFLDTIRWKGSDVLEYYNNARNDPSEKSYRTYILERNKLLDLKDKEEYNALNKEYKKAQEEAERTGAKVLYIINNVVYDIDTPDEVFHSVGIYEPDEIMYGIEVCRYLKAIGSAKAKYNNFILVTESERRALSDLENTPWQTDSFTVKYGDEIYKFGPNMK